MLEVARTMLVNAVVRPIFCAWVLLLYFTAVKWLPSLDQFVVMMLSGAALLFVTDVDKRIAMAALLRKDVAKLIVLIYCSYWVFLLWRWENGLRPGFEHESFVVYGMQMIVLGFPSSLIGLACNEVFAFSNLTEVVGWKMRALFEWLCCFLPSLWQLLMIMKKGRKAFER